MPTEAEVESAFAQLNSRLQDLEVRLTRTQEEKEGLAQEVERLRATGTPAGAAAGSSARARPGLVDTRLIGKPQSYDGDASRFADWAFVFKAYMSALDPAYQDAFEEIEGSQVPVLNATLPDKDVHLSTQLYYVLVMLCTGPALNKCYNAGVTEGYESWRQFVLQWEPKLASRFVGLLMQLLSFQFEGDLSARVSQFDRLVSAYEAQTKKKVDDSVKVGVAITGMRDAKVKEHLVRNAARLDTWALISAEVLEISRTQGYLNSTPVPMQLGALPPNRKGKGKGKGKSKGKPQQGKGTSTGTDNKDKECFYCKKKGHVKADCRARQRDLAAAEDKGGKKRQPGKPVSAMTVTDPVADPGFLLSLTRAEGAAAGSSACARDAAAGSTACSHRGPDTSTENQGTAVQPTRVAPLAGVTVCTPCAATVRPHSKTGHRLMIDNCAGASVFPVGYDDGAEVDDTVPGVTLTTATGEPVPAYAGRRSLQTARRSRDHRDV